MESTVVLKQKIQNGNYDQKFIDLYIDASLLAYQKKRYIDAISKFENLFGEAEVSVFSAPGRSEIGGNHTDHQHGEVLAASINLDAIAIVKKTDDSKVEIVSDERDVISISLNELLLKEEEKGTTNALIKGVLAGIKEKKYQIGGFQAYITSDVLIGAGLSSSAAFETIIGIIISGLYNDMSISPVDIAKIGQYSENVFFGKPCGLMDQIACSVGSLVYVNFGDSDEPLVEKLECDLEEYGYSLCITDTKGSHADLTMDYAAIPEEMKMIAHYFGKNVLNEVSEKTFYDNITKIRENISDRAVLRAIHYFNENKRVKKQIESLKNHDFKGFLKEIESSGNSSYKYLQNVYTCNDISNQNISVALAISEKILKNEGACRVHGGGFAGTIQAFVKNECVAEYRDAMNCIFGEDSCKVLKISHYGGVKVF